MPTEYIEVAVNVPHVMDVYHYHLPARLAGRVRPGHLVEVPFGPQEVQAVVLRSVREPSVATTRPVSALVDEQSVLTETQIALAQELSTATLAPLAACIALMLPPGLAQQADVLYSLLEPAQRESSRAEVYQTAQKILDLLEKRGPLRGRQIDRSLPKVDWRASARQLIKQGIIQAQPILLAPTVRPKQAHTAQLACPPEVAEAAMPGLAKAGTEALSRRQAMLRFLIQEPDPVDVTWVYAQSGGNMADLKVMEEMDLIALGESEVWRDPLANLEVQPNKPPSLTTDQKAAWEQVRRGLQVTSEKGPYLLHGVTGSGKTEIYLHAVAETLRQGRQAIVLVPEIALTPQAVHRFIARFPGRVGVLHSQLSQGERYDTWRRARAGLLSIVVGPRSALFTPFPNLGLIVIDECHDDSYYQSDGAIHYHAVEAALRYARLVGATCLLGSATPGVEMLYQARQERWHLLSLPNRLLAHKQVIEAQVQRLGIPSQYQLLSDDAETVDLPPVQVVDMRQELKAGHLSIFSRPLLAELSRVFERKQQAILFLNRRGTATFVFCRDCGYTLKCPHCDLPLTYHTFPPSLTDPEKRPSPALICHHCNYRRKLPVKCPECQSTRIRQYGTGTETVEKEVQRLFPQARTLRWDAETTQQKGAHEIILSHFANQRADVLVGTQMITKGLDLPMVTLVGAILADVGLSLPDYRAGERTFQVLTQVAGRAGRSPLGGNVILQTFQPEHYVIQAAARHDYASFYEKELEYRKQLGYPPYSRLVRLEIQHKNERRVEAAARGMADLLRAWIEAGDRRATELIGPAPCFFGQVADIYRWQIILRGPDPASLLRGRDLTGWMIEVDPVSLL